MRMMSLGGRADPRWPAGCVRWAQVLPWSPCKAEERPFRFTERHAAHVLHGHSPPRIAICNRMQWIKLATKQMHQAASLHCCCSISLWHACVPHHHAWLLHRCALAGYLIALEYRKCSRLAS